MSMQGWITTEASDKSISIGLCLNFAILFLSLAIHATLKPISEACYHTIRPFQFFSMFSVHPVSKTYLPIWKKQTKPEKNIAREEQYNFSNKEAYLFFYFIFFFQNVGPKPTHPWMLNTEKNWNGLLSPNVISISLF